MSAGLEQNGVPEGQRYSQDLKAPSNITLSPALDNDIFGMLTIIVDPKVPMTRVSCSGFSKSSIPYSVEIKVADENITCMPSATKDKNPSRASKAVQNISSDITIRFVKLSL